MPYFMIEDFQQGLDLRKSEITAPAGTLRKLKNGHVTAGGEIEKAKAWVRLGGLPSNPTFGLYAVGDRLFTFGSVPMTGTPGFITYQRLVAASVSAHMTAVLDVETFDGKPYVIAEYDNGAVHHFYDGARVTDWDQIAAQYGNNTLLARRLAEDIRTVSGGQLSVSSQGTTILVGGSTNRALTLSPFLTGSSQTLQANQIQTPGSGVESVWELLLGGTYNGATKIGVTITYAGPVSDPTDSVWVAEAFAASAAVARACKTFGNKMYAVAGSFLYFSGATGDPPFPNPTAWVGADLSGFINMATQSGGSQNLIGVAGYQNMLAVFSERDTQIWQVAANPDENVRWQVLDNIGALSAQSIQSFGDLDLFFLSGTGVRSLRARDSSNLASAQDVGSSIDVLVQEMLRASATVAFAPAAVEPTSGRYLLTLGTTTFVFSHYPGAKVSAWGTYEGIAFTDFAVTGARLFARAGNDIYLYGGFSGDMYPNAAIETEVQLPFLSAASPGTQKSLMSIDVGCEGTWDIHLHPDPTEPELSELLGTVKGSTYGFQPRFVISGQTTHFSLRFVHKGEGYARLANVAVHYEGNEAG